MGNPNIYIHTCKYITYIYVTLITEKAVAPYSSTFAWKIPWTEEPGRLQSIGSLESGTTEQLHFNFSLSCIGEGNGNPLQCSCLENPRDGEAWWAAVYGVVQSWTRLKRLSSSSTFIMRKTTRKKLKFSPWGWKLYLNHFCITPNPVIDNMLGKCLHWVYYLPILSITIDSRKINFTWVHLYSWLFI